MNMENNRIVNTVTLGWMEHLEEMPKVSGKKRKTVLFYKKLVREAGWDYTKISALMERKTWKRLVKDRIKHLDRWEKQHGNRYQKERIKRNSKM
ncbi:MAG: hypothetical protein GY696_16945 [Gammaproteobacteria bacterium]|nr:hypothetical protein [Gammaproteobacteria bacterium]